MDASPRLGSRGAPQAGQLPPGLGLIGHNLENAEVLLRGGGPVSGLGRGARQAEPGFEIARILAEHALPLVLRLIVLLGLLETPGQAEPKCAARAVEDHRLPILL